MAAGLYLSHASTEADTTQARHLRRLFADRGVGCATDDRRMGDRAALPAEVIDALDSAVGLVVLASPEGCDSPQVQAEVAHVIARRADRVAVIAWRLTREALAARWPALAKLGCHVLPDDPTDGERRRAVARAVTMLRPPERMAHDAVIDFGDIQVEGERVTAWVRMDEHAGEFCAPLGPDEAEKLRWYLEDYHRWPAAEFERRARAIEAKLPMWGQALWFALAQALGEALEPWLRDTVGGRRTLTLRVAPPRPVPLSARAEAKLIAPLGGLTRSAVLAAVAATRALPVDDRPPEQIERDAAENAAQARLLALPWELLAREGEPLMQRDIAIRRVMVPRERGEPIGPRKAPIRVLVVVARPDEAGLIDPRASADALIDAVAPLGGAVALTFLRPPTLDALAGALRDGDFDVLHFDGHGVYEPHSGLGFLCFEHRDPEKRRQGEPELIHGAALREALGDKPLPLAFLEACQTGQSTETADAAVAAAMLAAGAGSVIAMSHSVLVTTAGLFTAAFYRALTEGRTIAQAVTRARQAVAADKRRGTAIELVDDPAARARGEMVRKKTFELTDWHVPQLYQRDDDPTLLPGGVALLGDDDAVYALEDRYATVPPVLGHGFVGRLTERLALERALEDHPIALIVGAGGQGKTTLAAELGRWLVRCRRFHRAAFVSVEHAESIEGVVNSVGRALIGAGFIIRGVGAEAVAEATDAIVRALRRHPGLVILDNLESLLPAPDASETEALAARHALLAAVLDFAWTLRRCGASRVLITSREALGDARFQNGDTCHVHRLGPLAVRDAVALVGDVCRNEGIAPEAATDAALEDLVRAAGCHARSLVLLPGLLRGRGVAAVTADLHGLMAELEAANPGMRELSPLASVRLSLDRLPARWRGRLAPLGLLRVGVSTPALGHLLGLSPPEVHQLADALEARALAHREIGGNSLRFHPALTAVLEAELRDRLPPAEVAARHAATVAAYVGLVRFFYSTIGGPQAATAVALTVAELPNLLRVLDHLAAAATDPDRVAAAIDYATSLEGLLQTTPHRRALTAVAERRAALADLAPATAWSHAQHNAAMAAVERLLEAGRVAEAVTAAEAARRRGAEAAAGGEPYPEAPYDRAMAAVTLGRARRLAGDPAAAFEAIEEARAGFEALAAATGDRGAARMASACLTEGADCLLGLRRLDAAAARYAQAIEALEPLDDPRSVAVTRGQLATVRLLQGELAAALSGWQQARDTFAALGEPAAVATAWHQIGRVHEQARQWADAEAAYQQSVTLKLGRGDRLGAAASMNQIAIVTDRAGRLEESVAWDRRALAIFEAERHRAYEARSRNNLADRLRRLRRLDEAAAEARQAAAIRDALGLGAEPWTTWGILHNIHRDRGDTAAAAEARDRAIEWYRRFRDQDGEPSASNPETGLFAGTARAFAAGQPAAVAAELDALVARPDFPDWLAATARALAALCRGDRAPAVALMATCDFDTHVEFERLLATLPPARA